MVNKANSKKEGGVDYKVRDRELILGKEGEETWEAKVFL